MFKRNEGILDRIVRVTLGMVFLPAGLFLFGGLQGGVLGLVIAGLGVIGLITGFTGVCPTYSLFGISTLEIEKELIDRCKSMAAGCWPSDQPGVGQWCGSSPQSIEKTDNPQG